MFTGLVRCLGTVKDVAVFGSGRRFRIDVGMLAESTRIGQSIAVNGVCLTVTSLAGSHATFDSVAETVSRSNLGSLRGGDRVNLEPALKAGDALDGHIVLGHVDALAPVIAIDASREDNRIIRIALPVAIRGLVAEKGSIAVNGISLTVSEAAADWFTIAVIPHTWSNSSLALLSPGDGVNLEVDVMARYVARLLQFPPVPEGTNDGVDNTPAASGIFSEDFLRKNGFA